jgi:predicted secreted protein
MNKKYTFALAASAIALTLSACQTNPQAMPGTHMKAPIVLNQNSANSVRVGDLITVELESNPSTGFLWQMAQDFDVAHMSIVDERFVAKDSTPGLVGVGGKQVWVIKAVKPGSSSIILSRAQGRNKNSLLELATFEVNIKP